MDWIENTESKWRNFDMTLLKVDESYLNLVKETQHKLSVYYLNEDCFKCPYQKFNFEDNTVKIDGSRVISFKVFGNNEGKYVFENETSSICSLKSYFGEFGVYNLTIQNNKNCSILIDKNPVSIYKPILTVILISIVITIIAQLISFFLHKLIKKNVVNETSSQTVQEVNVNKRKRLKSLDIFRGLAITLMIFVNSGGGHYSWIEHAPWNGLHVADVVFPSFLWIMGVAIPFSVNVQLNRSMTKISIFKNIFIRSLKLFFIGLCLNSMDGPLLSDLRIMGVLQRFSITYFICASFYVAFTKIPSVSLPQINFKLYFRDIIILREQLLFCTVLIIIYLSIIFGYKAPFCPLGYNGPGGIHENALYQNCTGGIIGYIDELILGKSHIYQHSTAKHLYNSKNFDPEGIFGCILSTVQVFFGIQCGVILQVYTCWKNRCIRLSIWGLILGILGGILCLFRQEDGIIPINKNLWSLSFLMTTTSISFFILAVLYIIADVKNLWNGYPFLQSGMNSIALYIGHSVAHKMLPWHWRIGLMNTHFVLMLECVWNTTLWVLIAINLYKKKIFYNV